MSSARATPWPAAWATAAAGSGRRATAAARSARSAARGLDHRRCARAHRATRAVSQRHHSDTLPLVHQRRARRRTRPAQDARPLLLRGGRWRGHQRGPHLHPRRPLRRDHRLRPRAPDLVQGQPRQRRRRQADPRLRAPGPRMHRRPRPRLRIRVPDRTAAMS
jgi:hypothetical protein